MKVLHCITGTNVGGAEVMLYRYLRSLGERKDDHVVLSVMPIGVIGQRIAELGVRVHDAGMRQGRPSLASLMRVRRIIQAERADVVHGWMYHGCLIAKLAMMGSRKAPGLVWGIHHSLSDIRNEPVMTRGVVRLSALLSRQVQGISYCSSVSQTQHQAVGFSGDRARLIPNAIDTNEFVPDRSAKPRLAALCGIPPERMMIGNVARDHPMKDQASMVRATADLLQKGYDVQAVIIGSGHSKGQARKAAEELGIDDRVSTFETRSDIQELVPGFDIFLLSSAWGEAFPLSVCEALSCAVPVVVTDVGDSGLLVGEHGVVVPPADPLAQSAGLQQILDLSETKRRQRGADGRAHVEANYSMGRYIAEHDAFYAAAVEGDAYGRTAARAAATEARVKTTA